MACRFPGRRPRRRWMQCCSSYPVRMMATREDPGGWPEGAIFNVALVGSPCKLPSKAGARPATGPRALLNHSHAPRSQRHAARCQTSVLAPLREMSLHNAFPHASRCIQPKCTGGSSSLSPLSAAFFKVSDRKATADAAQEGTESLGAEARIYAYRHPKLIDRGCITPVSAETRRLDASSRH